MMGRQGTAGAVGGAGLLLLATAPPPAAAVALLQDPATAADPTAPVVALLSLLAWLLVGWLALTVALTAGSRLPGRVGRALAAVARRTAPVAVRRAVEVALGMTVAVGALGTPAAAAPLDHGSAAAPAGVPSLDWGAPPVELPAAPPAVAPPSVPAEAAPHQTVVVRPGDTLWALAAQELAVRSDAAPRDAEVAQRWPAWWSANRDAVGDDPHHITPGQHLTAPPA